MATISTGYTFASTEEVTAGKLASMVNDATISGIVAADITDGVITNAKIASVAGSKFTSFSTIPAGSGVIPVANIDTGTTASKIVILDASAKLPAVDGSQLTGVTFTAALGSLTAKSANTVYQAGTDGFVICNATAGTSYVDLYAEAGDDTPDELRARFYADGGAAWYGSIAAPVLKGEYWKIDTTATVTIYWIPLGT